jgi:TonB-dependent starch-binding outer membrane protein SusC
MAAAASQARAQSGVGIVQGTVLDSAGRRMDHASVTITGTRLGASTDSAGRYVIGQVPLGTIELKVRRLGYWADSMKVAVTDSVPVRADFRIRQQVVELLGTEIVADPNTGKMGAFNQRRSRGVGSFITRADIEKRQASSVSELLRYLPGVAVSQRMAGEPQPVHMQRSVNTTTTGKCSVQIYVDGHPYQNGNVDDFNPNGVEGIEVYRSASEIPGAFRARDATCGVIAIWTRDPDAARRKP